MTETNPAAEQRNPFWFKMLNWLFLLPCVAWPLVFFSTIFFFDNPKSFFLTLLLFIAVNAYPMYLVGILFLNARLFRRHRVVATILPLAFGVGFVIAVVQFLGGPASIMKLGTQIISYQEGETMQEQLCCGYSSDSTNVLYNDTIVPGADLASFEIINYNWAKDKDSVYYNGSVVRSIDRETFRYLDYHYAVDKSNVYYDDEIIEGADAVTFRHMEGTQDGKDRNYCYRYGERVDCKVLLRDE